MRCAIQIDVLPLRLTLHLVVLLVGTTSSNKLKALSFQMGSG